MLIMNTRTRCTYLDNLSYSLSPDALSDLSGNNNQKSTARKYCDFADGMV